MIAFFQPNTKLNTKQSSLLFSVLLCFIIILLFIALSPEKFLHWSIIPIFISGVIIGTYLIRLITNKISIFDPIGIIGVFGFWFFFLTPLLHILYDYWMPLAKISSPSDWKEWIGVWATLNLFGLLIFKFTLNLTFQKAKFKPKLWSIYNRTFWPSLIIGLLVSLGLQILVYIKFGGILGYIITFEEAYIHGFLPFLGWGIIFSLSESFPVLFFFLYILLAQRNKFIRKPSILWFMFIIFVILKILFGGLRGSRFEIIVSLFWAAATIYFMLRSFRIKEIFFVGLFSLAFLYIYGFYKGAGRDVFSLLTGKVSLEELEKRTRRDEFVLFLGDLSRADVQSFLLYRLLEVREYEYAWGRTYIGTLSLLIPRFIWPERPPTKVKEGTEALYGPGSYPIFRATNVYGFAGEIMLNFGPLFVPIGFAIWGWLVGLIRRLLFNLNQGDPRFLVIPWLIVFVSLSFPMSDSDNLLFFLAKYIALPYFIVFIGTKKINLENCVRK